MTKGSEIALRIARHAELRPALRKQSTEHPEGSVTEPTTQTVSHLVIGAGPAGLQLAKHLQDAGRTYAVLEAGAEPGMFFATFPRHRTLISINKIGRASCRERV